MIWSDQSPMITKFRGNYNFLSNFSSYPFNMEYKGKLYYFQTSEHAYQAFRCESEKDFEKIMNSKTPSEAKKMSHGCFPRIDWEEIKDAFMYIILKNKFCDKGNKDAVDLLISTYPSYLLEGNDWGDTYWGCCFMTAENKWVGQNVLGNLLMMLRYHKIMERKLEMDILK